MTFGEKIKQLRENRGWTQTQAAEKLGVSSQVVSNYERDYRSPDKEMLVKLSRLFNVTVGFLVDEDTQVEEPEKYDFRKDPRFLSDPRFIDIVEKLKTLPESEIANFLDHASVLIAGLEAKAEKNRSQGE